MELVIDEQPYLYKHYLLMDDRMMDLHLWPVGEVLVGNIYLGYVEHAAKGMDSVFVNIGNGEKGVLPISEQENATTKAQSLSPGHRVIVQVNKMGRDGKRPVLTQNLQFAGGYIIYMPKAGYGTASRQLSYKKGQHLKKVMKSVTEANEGFILRSAAGYTNSDTLKAEWRRLQEQWRQLKDDIGRNTGEPRLLQSGWPMTVSRLFNRCVTEDIDVVISNDQSVLMDLSDMFAAADCEPPRFNYRRPLPETVQKVCRETMRQATQPVIRDKNGMTIHIHETEALTAIDINMGRFKTSENKIEAAYAVNEAAIPVIMRQMKLRQLHGIILIDALKMDSTRHRMRVLDQIKQWAETDSVRTKVYGYTQTGLIELSRQSAGFRLKDWVKQKGSFEE